MSIAYTDFIEEPVRLRIVLLEEHRQEVAEIAANPEWTADQKLAEVLEYQLTNGWTWLTPQQAGNALTDAPILASPDAHLDEEDTLLSDEHLYWYRDYQVYDPVERLLTNGEVIFFAPD